MKITFCTDTPSLSFAVIIKGECFKHGDTAYMKVNEVIDAYGNIKLNAVELDKGNLVRFKCDEKVILFNNAELRLWR